jgi:hypothetical protein
MDRGIENGLSSDEGEPTEMKRKNLAGEEWTNKEQTLFRKFTSPVRIQTYLNAIPYNSRPTAYSPHMVMQKHTAHCFEGAMFAAAAFRRLGYPPLIVDMMSHNDDDHVIAVFRERGLWGAVAKSNFTTLRFREPVYRTLRELVMSYFDFFYNTKGEKTLRSYSKPVDLSRFDDRQWMTSREDLHYIGEYLYRVKHIDVMPRSVIRSLHPVERDLMKAGLLGSVKKGLYKPK